MGTICLSLQEGVGQVFYSSDGISWTDSSPGGNDLEAITYGNNRFVTVGESGQAWWSPDGTPGSWTDSSPGGGNTLFGIAYGNARFVAVGESGQAWYSSDGTTGSWIDSSPGGNNLEAIAFRP